MFLNRQLKRLLFWLFLRRNTAVINDLSKHIGHIEEAAGESDVVDDILVRDRGSVNRIDTIGQLLHAPLPYNRYHSTPLSSFRASLKSRSFATLLFNAQNRCRVI